MTNRSQELYDQWEEHGGDLQQYEYPREIENERGYVTWFRSGVVRWSNLQDRKDHVIREKLEDLDEQQSHIRWKHRRTDTWVHLKSSTTRIVGEPIGFEAYVTVEGQSLTVGENHVTTDPQEAIQWAINWMENHPDGYDPD